jgi:tyrosyl-tRNA synthetase
MRERDANIEQLLSRGVAQVINREHLRRALRSGKKLRVKLGIDPTAPDLHLGNAVVLRKLREFQELGHQIVFIIGDFTAQIGDPSARSAARKPLTPSEIRAHQKKYLAQAGKILSIRKTRVHHNSEWLGKLSQAKLLGLLSTVTAQQMLERDDFAKRIASRKPLHLHELIYPVLQGYDSVMVGAHVELGGTDQTFNLLAGRTLMARLGMTPQDILTVPLLEGLDGVRKMSKSFGNYIGLNESADEMFGEIMSIPDSLVARYFLLCTDVTETAFAKLTRELSPRDLKARLGVEIVKLYHGAAAAKKASEAFTRLFTKKEITGARVPLLALARRRLSVLELVLATGVPKSKSEARRLITQGGVHVGSAAHRNPSEKLTLKSGDILKIGKRRFFRVK